MQLNSSLSKTKSSSPSSERQYEAWETLAPLDELERDSIRELQQICLELPLPKKFLPESTSYNQKLDTLDDLKAGASRLALPEDSMGNNAGTRTTSSASKTGSNLGAADSYTNMPESLTKILPEKPTQSVSSFLQWFSTLEPKFLTNQEKSYKCYQALLFDYKQKAASTLAEFNSVRDTLSELSSCQAQIQNEMAPIRVQCAESLQNKVVLEAQVSKIEAQLRPFEQLSQIHQFLSRPGNDLCVNPRFNTILQQLDSGLAFMNEHSTFKDADLYLARYQQSMTRSLSLIHLYFSDQLEPLKPTAAEDGVTFSASLADNHQKFRYLASEMRPLICHVELRSHVHIDHSNLLADCYNLLIASRLSFLKLHLPVLVTRDELFDALIDGAAQMQSVLRDEESLFRSFFAEGEAELTSFLDELLTLFYEQWLASFLKRFKNLPPTLRTSAPEAIAFLGPQVRILECKLISQLF
ncbi:Golgi transport complex subunit 3, variant 2 [Entomophthora muscae]|uniref:Golgi transport complex subunit 3, variant 2 n=1 Tax=Entomophthora muscae TaxID=34485 RepID=A0ACC2UKV0_9FUNG|nr:Golgi transport complex subunit 3, variant 2 [Entomophthora muscae]